MQCRVAHEMRKLAFISLSLVLFLGLTVFKTHERRTGEYHTWSTYGGGPENIHYSSLKQINRKNVSNLASRLELRYRRCVPRLGDGMQSRS